MIGLPSAPGTYALQMHLARPHEQEIGRLGRFWFPAGELIYIGSAFGSGGLQARVGRHLKYPGKHHWHIDYLLPITQPIGLWASTLPFRLECRWAAALASLPGADFPAVGFGCSDCRNGCPAHLLAFSEFDQAAVSERLDEITHEVAALQQIGECRVFRAIGQSHLDDLPPPE